MDMLADFAEPLPAMVTAELLGVPVEDHVKLKDWSVTFAEMLGNFQHNPDRLAGVLEAVENLTEYFHDAIREQRRHPRDGLVSALLAAEVDGDRLTDEEVGGQLHRHDGRRPGDHHEPDRQRHADAAAQPRRTWSACGPSPSSCPARSRSCCATRAPASTPPGSPATTSCWAASRSARARR